MDTATATALANEARRQTVKQAIAGLQARVDNASSLIGVINSTISDAQTTLTSKQQELAAIEAGAGPGVSGDWGSRVDFVTAFIAALLADGLITDEQQTTYLAVMAGTYAASNSTTSSSSTAS